MCCCTINVNMLNKCIALNFWVSNFFPKKYFFFHIPSVNLEGNSRPLLPSSASARQPPCQALSVSWKLVNELHKQPKIVKRHAFYGNICMLVTTKYRRNNLKKDKEKEWLCIQYETTWGSPALIQPPHLPAPWEAFQSPYQSWRVM